MRVSDRNDKEIIINDSNDLRAAIDELILKKELQSKAIANSFTDIKESLKPVNLVKNAFNKLTENQTPIQLGLKVAGTLAAGIVAKKVLTKKGKKIEVLEDENDVKYVEIEQAKTSIFTKLALALATNYLITKIPVVSAYTSAITNQFSNKEDDEDDEGIEAEN